MKRKVTIFLLAFTLTLMVLSFFDSSGVANASNSPGISLTIEDVDPNASGTDNQATYIVKVESITTDIEDGNITITGHASLTFDWTLQEFFGLLPGEVREFPLTVTVADCTDPGDYGFTATCTAWLPFLPEFPETSSYTSYVHVTSHIGPEVVGGSRILTPLDAIKQLIPWITVALIAAAFIVVSAKTSRKEQ